jgi:hypothetical protein
MRFFIPCRIDTRREMNAVSDRTSAGLVFGSTESVEFEAYDFKDKGYRLFEMYDRDPIFIVGK